jgi:hypothetical protein
MELRAVQALRLPRDRRAQGAYPIVLQDLTAVAVCHVARVRQHIAPFGPGRARLRPAWAGGLAVSSVCSVMKRDACAALISPPRPSMIASSSIPSPVGSRMASWSAMAGPSRRPKRRISLNAASICWPPPVRLCGRWPVRFRWRVSSSAIGWKTTTQTTPINTLLTPAHELPIIGLSGLLQLCRVVQKLRAAHAPKPEGGSVACPIVQGASFPPVANVSGTHAVGAIATTDAQSLTGAVESAVGATTPEYSYQSRGGQRR